MGGRRSARRDRGRRSVRLNRAAPFAVVAALAALVVAATVWPIVAAGGFTEHDAAFSAAQMGWLQQALLHGRSWWDAPLGWPGTEGTTRADWVPVQALLSLPWSRSGPDAAWVAAAIAGIGITALAAGWAGRRLLGDGPHLLPVMLVLAVGPAVVPHLQHANLLYTGIGLAAALLLNGEPRRALAAGVLLGVSFHAGLYTGLRAAALMLAVLAVRRDARGALGVAIGLVLVSPTLVPVFRHYAAAAGAQAVGWRENAEQSVDLLELLAPPGGSPVYTALLGPEPMSMHPPLPGFALTIVAAVGFWLRRREPTWRWLLVGVLGCLLLAFGSPLQVGGEIVPVSGPWLGLDWASGHRLRDPARWLVYTHLGLAFGAAAALAALPAKARWPASLLLTAAFLLESPRPRGGAATRWPAAVLEAAAALPAPGPLWNIAGRDGCADGEFAAALRLDRPLVGGSYARFDEALAAVNRLGQSWPGVRAAKWAREHGVGLIVEHPPLTEEAPAGFRCTTVEQHRLCVVADVPVSAPQPPSAGLQGPT